MKQKDTSLLYESLDVEGQCILKQIKYLQKNNYKFVLFILLNIITAGIPILLIFWHPSLQRLFYFDYLCDKNKATHFWIKNYDQVITIVKRQYFKILQNQNQPYQTIGFQIRYLKYYLNQHQTIRAIRYNINKKIKQVLQMQQTNKYKGLSFDQVLQLRNCYGKGAMIIQKPSLFELFIKEIFKPMFLFVIFSIILWFNQDYKYYASIIAISMIISLVINLIQSYSLNNKIHHMAYYQTKLNVLRQNQIVFISSLDIVPGDVVFFNNNIQSNFKIPFDGKILQGSILINQCSLTGESVPVVKKGGKCLQNLQSDKSNIIYQGTLIIQLNSNRKFKYFQQYRQCYGVAVIVQKTNFLTSKGSLIRIIRFPKQLQNLFQKQSSKFLIFIFFFTLLSYSLLAIRLYDVVGLKQVIMRIMDVVTVTIPPGLPVSMTLGIIYAVEKLQNKNIFCTSQNNVIKGGSVQQVCFDKTGTLTQNFMDFYGLLPYYQHNFQTIIKNQAPITQQTIYKIPQLQRIFYNFGSNHTLIQNLKTSQIIGDPMQQKLFIFGDFKFDYSQTKNVDLLFCFKNKSQKIKGNIYKVFQFDSEVQRMSVICQNKQKQTYLYCKGSPQVLRNLFTQQRFNSLQYDEQLKYYNSQGYRTLAIGSKRINNIHQSRQQLQKQLNFDGFVIFQNKLKPESHSAILQLKQADIKCTMITGDNPLTACCMALQCEIADNSKAILICDLNKNQLKIQQFNNKQATIQIIIQNQQNQVQRHILKQIKNYPNHQLCLTGNVFARLFQTKTQQYYSNQLKDIFSKCTIFARAKPNQKAKVVSIYQTMGKVVGMCGDGANDCGALKQAQIGLSLSQTQASISAPFTSKVFNIKPMVELIKQCRAALATNFSLFNIMAMYSLIQYTSVLICQYFYAYPSDIKQFYWDFGGNFLLLIAYGYIGTSQVLSKQKPLNSLFSIPNIIQLLSMLFIQLAGQILCVYMTMSVFSNDIGYYEKGGIEFNTKYYRDNQDFPRDSTECNIIFLFSNLLYISSFIAFSIEAPWRKRFYTCIPFLILFLIVTVYSSLLMVMPSARLKFFKLQQLNDQHCNIAIFCLSGIFCWIIYFNQKIILEPLANWKKRQQTIQQK